MAGKKEFRVTEPIKIENARIIYRNFAGAKGRYNTAGYRSFSVVIEDPAVAAALEADGWNIKQFKPREDEELENVHHHMQVVVSFESSTPPKITMLTRKSMRDLNEDTIADLDSADIQTVDLVIRPYNWTQPDGRRGVKGYLKTMYVVIEQDEFADKYADFYNKEA